jgi:hypothetical protein
MRLRGKHSSELLDRASVRVGETAARRSLFFARRGSRMTFGGLPILAPLKHARLSCECPFTGVDRKSPSSGQTDAFDPNRAWHAARRIQMIRPWLRRVDALSRSSINSANPDRYLPRPIAKATETRTCKTLPDGQPSSPEQHQASD